MSAIPSNHNSMTQTTRLTAMGVERPWVTIMVCVLVAMLFGAAFPWAKIDTNPKNMLPD